MQNFLNKNRGVNDKLIKLIGYSANYDYYLNRQLTNFKHIRTFSLFKNSSIKLSTKRSSVCEFTFNQTSNQLSTKLLIKSTNHSTKLISQLNHAQFYSDWTSEQEFDFLNNNNNSFNTTEIGFTQLPDLKLDRRRKGRRFNREMSLDSPGKPKWHLKNVFYLLKTNYEDDDEKAFKNVNRFNVLTDFKKDGDVWLCLITLFHPSKQTFRANSKRKLEAEDNASLNAILWLRDQGIISTKF